MQTSSAPAVQLFAVTAAGPQALPVPAGAATFHDVLDGHPLGVYSALRTFHHDRFLGLEAHLDRTDKSMELLGWKYRIDRPALRRALHQVVSAWPHADSRVRFDVLADEQPAERSSAPSRTLIALSPFKPVPERFLREGVRVQVARELHRDQPLIKTAEFVVRRRPLPLERQEAYEHVLLDDSDRILEGSSSNFHAVRGGDLFTAAGGALEGITQKILLRLAEDLGIRIRREHVRLAEIQSLDEAFLTSSTRGIVPIVGVAESQVGTGTPGPITARLRRAYEELAEHEAAQAV